MSRGAVSERKVRQVTVRVCRLAGSEGLALPSYQSSAAAGMDLVAAVAPDAPIRLAPGVRALVPTGLAIALPEGFEAQVRPRSGLALRAGITVLNSPGTIDADYRGEIRVLLINLGEEAFEVRRGDRIAQLVIQPVVRCRWVPVPELEDSERGEGGFGSTGI